MFNVDMDVSAVADAIKSFEPGGSAQRFFTNELMRLSDDYVPMNSGVLKNSAKAEKGGTAIIYETPYARYHWYGKMMADPVYGKGAFFKEGYGFWSRPNVEKVLTDKNMKYQESPRRGPRWVERCFIDNKDKLIDAVLEYIEVIK